jgi:hypothetical protein
VSCLSDTTSDTPSPYWEDINDDRFKSVVTDSVEHGTLFIFSMTIILLKPHINNPIISFCAELLHKHLSKDEATKNVTFSGLFNRLLSFDEQSVMYQTFVFIGKKDGIIMLNFDEMNCLSGIEAGAKKDYFLSVFNGILKYLQNGLTEPDRPPYVFMTFSGTNTGAGDFGLATIVEAGSQEVPIIIQLPLLSVDHCFDIIKDPPFWR